MPELTAVSLPSSPQPTIEYDDWLDDDLYVEPEDDYDPNCDCAECRANRLGRSVAAHIYERRGSYMPSLDLTDYYRQLNHGCELPEGFSPNIRVFHPEQAPEMASQLRQVFAFFRRHDDGRYSANSKMKLLAFADKLEDDDWNADEAIRLVLAEVPFNYDPETEVKTGGIVGAAVMLPGGRMMVAVHKDRRRSYVGKTMFYAARDYINLQFSLWVHRSNIAGQHFALSMGFSPWNINPAGAIQFSEGQPQAEDVEAVAFCDEAELDMRLRQQQRQAAARVRDRFVRAG